MKRLSICVLLSQLFFQVQSLTCTKKTSRTEWRQLSRGQQLNYLAAINAIKNRPASPGNNFESWNYDQFAKLHYSLKDNNHGLRTFFPWHRLFTFYFEKALQSVDPSVTLPWWDWAADAANPTASPLFQPDAFGGDGDPTTHCITSGISKDWKSVAGTPDIIGGCVKRQFSFTGLWPSVAISTVLSTADFDTLFHGIENGPHGAIHLQLGGEAGDFAQMWSANDALFWVHHGMADKSWWMWQNSCKDFATMYSGAASEALPPFSETVGDTFDVSSCYDYTRSTAHELSLTVTCPSGRTVPPFAGGSALNNTTTPTNNTTPTPPTNSSTVVNNEWLQQSIVALVYKASNTVKSKAAQGSVGKLAVGGADAATSPPQCLQRVVSSVGGGRAMGTMGAMGVSPDRLDSIYKLANDAIDQENARRGCP